MQSNPTTPLTPALEVLRLYRKNDFTLCDALSSRLEKDPQKLFCIYAGQTYTWQQFHDDVNKACHLFKKQGIKKGDRFGVMARNQYAHIVILFALSKLCAIMVPINPDFSVGEASYVINHADLFGLALDEHGIDNALLALKEKNLDPWLISLIQTDKQATQTIPKFKELLETITPQAPLATQALPDDTCIIIYTSGTTGFPKGVMHSQRSFILTGEAFVERVYLQPNDRVMIVLPMFHMNALFYSVSGVIASGCTMIIQPRFSASEFWIQATHNKATVINIIEAACNILKARSRSEFREDHHLRCAYGVRQSAQAAFRDEFKVPYFVSGYGMTEIPGVTCSPYGGLQKAGSMGPEGKHPDPEQTWAKCKIVDDLGQEVATGQVGELIVQTPIVTQGYFRDEVQTEQAFRDGWFLTGDLVTCDEDGYYTFVSRKKDIIRRRGENIAGAELDRVILEHPNVAEVATIAVPAELGEDEILVAVVLKKDVHMSHQDVADWCAQKLSAMKVPRFVIFLDALPYTPTNKIAKAVLRADASLRQKAVDLQLKK
jgi:crotonobetaine/carnitine-CoA ligase